MTIGWKCRIAADVLKIEIIGVWAGKVCKHTAMAFFEQDVDNKSLNVECINILW